MDIIVTLPAADMERARGWYSKVLGLEPVEVEEMGETWYELEGVRFLVYPSQFAGSNEATAAGIRVEDTEATVAELKARGAVFEHYDFGDDFRTVDGILTLPDGRKSAWMKDSEGNIIGITSSSR